MAEYKPKLKNVNMNTQHYSVTQTEPVLSGKNMSTLFDPRQEIAQLKARTPRRIVEEMQSQADNQQNGNFKTAYIQDVMEYVHTQYRPMVVEVTSMCMHTPYEQFVSQLPPEQWGRRLAGYLGGEVQVLEKDAQLRATRQIERMVLAAPLKNLDMTKSEVIVYAPDQATVYWRVYYSNNQTTQADLGYVTFARQGKVETRVTFQSAHKLYVPNFLLRWMLADTFMRHLENYQRRS